MTKATPPTPPRHAGKTTSQISRQHRHRRSITLDGFVRHDGLIEVEAEIRDTKTYAFSNMDRGEIKAGEALHHMRVRIAVDESLIIREAEAETISAPYHICPSATAVFSNLVGVAIASGWQRNVRKAIGTNHGCTHITQLMGQVGTVVMQTTFGERRRRMTEENAKVGAKHKGEGSKPYAPPTALINTCYSYRPESPVVKRLWPDYGTSESGEAKSSDEKTDGANKA